MSLLALASCGIDATATPASLGPATNLPPEYAALVDQAGSICPAITAALIAAQIDVESGWDPTAMSPAGARGISQFMPETWDAVGADYNADGRSDPLDPADAIPAQGSYMCGLHDAVTALLSQHRVEGDPVALTLAAYNAGIGAVQDARGVPDIVETRAYVQRVFERVDLFASSSSHTGATSSPLPAGFGDADNWGATGSVWSSGVHTGDDFPAPCGTTVMAATSGSVTIRRDQPWAGIGLVEVTRPDGLVTWYAHLQSITVDTGQAVIAGQPVGQVGDLGNAYGCHLHFEVHPSGGASVDPHDWLIAQGVSP